MEDFGPFRALITSLVRGVRHLQVVCEATEGLEAVEKAQELRPDLILLDIGLPGLNGIESARLIRKSLAESKIIFVSQETSASIVQEALSLGACGYVVKPQVETDLIAAIEAVLQGRTFVSAGLKSQDPQDWSDPDFAP